MTVKDAILDLAASVAVIVHRRFIAVRAVAATLGMKMLHHACFDHRASTTLQKARILDHKRVLNRFQSSPPHAGKS